MRACAGGAGRGWVGALGVLLATLPACLVSIPDLREKPASAGAGGDAAAGSNAGGAGAPTVDAPRCSDLVDFSSRRVELPADAGAVDVTLAPYLARGDGVTDDTAALQQAISDYVGTGRILYLPPGNYLVSDTLDAIDQEGDPLPAITLQGNDATRTRIQLAPGAAGFDDPDSPKPVVRLNGSGAGQAHRNHVMDLAIHVGAHPGAIALDFVGHNRSSVEHVALSADPGGGAIGLELTRPWAGSRLISNVRVDGFDVGISIGQEKFGNTLEHIELRGQRRLGLTNDRSFTVIRDLKSNNRVPALQSTHALGMLVLLEDNLQGGAADQPAVASEGELFARDLEVQGYGPSIELRGLEVAHGNISEFTSRDPARLAGTSKGSLGLPIEETPEPLPPPLEDWLSAGDEGAVADDEVDDTAAIQAALDSGAPAVYFPFGEYLVSAPLTIPPSLRLLFGMDATVRLLPGTSFVAGGEGDALTPVLRIDAGQEPLRVERLLFASDSEDVLAVTLFEHQAPRELTLALIDGDHRGLWSLLYRAEPGAGRVFFQCFHGGGIRLQAGQKAWLRAGNFEGDQPMVDNAGAELWALGLKSYTPHTLIATRAQGKTELIGAFLLPEPTEPEPSPAFTIEDAEASLVFATFTDQADAEYPVHVRETRAGVTQELVPDAERVLGVGSYVPLFVGHDRSARVCQ